MCVCVCLEFIVYFRFVSDSLCTSVSHFQFIVLVIFSIILKLTHSKNVLHIWFGSLVFHTKFHFCLFKNIQFVHTHLVLLFHFFSQVDFNWTRGFSHSIYLPEEWKMGQKKMTQNEWKNTKIFDKIRVKNIPMTKIKQRYWT